jgi:hypothetical protein
MASGENETSLELVVVSSSPIIFFMSVVPMYSSSTTSCLRFFKLVKPSLTHKDVSSFRNVKNVTEVT